MALYNRNNFKKPKVIFFDGDGTLWYPRSTLRTRKPHWVYLDETIIDPIAEMIVTPKTITTLQQLGDLGVARILLSTCPLEETAALAHRKAIAEHVGVFDLLDEIKVAPEIVNGKSEIIAEWLTKNTSVQSMRLWLATPINGTSKRPITLALEAY